MHIVDAAAQERKKYEEIWSFPEYADYSPGGEHVERFMELCKPPYYATVIDIGCGRGNAGLELQKRKLNVWWLDITGAALDPKIECADFIEAPLWSHWQRPMGWHYGFCVDVLEHIPTEYTMLCIERIVRACGVSYLVINNEPDAFGKKIGEPLHLTVANFDWWKIRIATIGKLIEARDLCGSSLFVVERT
jgi:SAM-dependent methyltransferase